MTMRLPREWQLGRSLSQRIDNYIQLCPHPFVSKWYQLEVGKTFYIHPHIMTVMSWQSQ